MEEVLRENLKSNEEYYIECLTEDNYKNIIPNKNIRKLIGIFLNLKNNIFNNYPKLVCFCNFREINNPKFIGYDVELNGLWKFYKIKKHLIQNAMEKRACNLIIQRIVNDPYFNVDFI
jgi:hypothetical protein